MLLKCHLLLRFSIQQIELLVFWADPCTVNNALTAQSVGLEDASPGPDRKLTCGFVPSSRESDPGQRGEPGHAPGVGPNPPGAQQSIELSSAPSTPRQIGSEVDLWSPCQVSLCKLRAILCELETVGGHQKDPVINKKRLCVHVEVIANNNIKRSCCLNRPKHDTAVLSNFSFTQQCT